MSLESLPKLSWYPPIDPVDDLHPVCLNRHSMLHITSLSIE